MDSPEKTHCQEIANSQSKFEHQKQWIWYSCLAIAAGVIGYFLFTEHRAHMQGALPYLIFLLCPLLHFFHFGHGKGHSHLKKNDGTESKSANN